MNDFSGKIALVTGAGSGIGRETALFFTREGARVACADINGDAVEDTLGFIRQKGGDGLAIQADLSTPEACQMVVTRTVEGLGGLHHAFNNAGIAGQFGDNTWNLEGIGRTITINLEAVIWGMKAQVAHMVANGGGTIVNTASIAGISGNVGALDYTAAKHGVVGFTKAAARMYGPQGVRINAVCPGLIETPMSTMGDPNRPGADTAIQRLSPILGHMGEPADIAEAVLWLSSAKSKFVFGVALPVDGGFIN